MLDPLAPHGMTMVGLVLTIEQKAPVSWEPVDVTPILKDGKTAIPDAAIESIKRNKIALKGPLAVCLCPVPSR